MLDLDPSDPQELTFALLKGVKQSGMTQAGICERLRLDYGVEITPSALSHMIHRGTIRLQWALQILAVCGVEKVRIEQKV
jgi:hypothetical protein